MADLDKIGLDIAGCDQCPLSKQRTHAVPGEGNADADLLFIGEGPGKREDELGRPFVGGAGKFLDEMLTLINLTRKDVFITNIVKCRPPNNRDPEPAEVETCTTLYLYKQINIIKPKLIIPLGRHSMHRFLPEDFKISQVHGNPYRRKGQVFFPLYHPAAALYRGSMRDVLIKDFKKIPFVLKKV